MSNQETTEARLILDPTMIRADWTQNCRTKVKARKDTKKGADGAEKTVLSTDADSDDFGNDAASIEKLADSMKGLGQQQPVGVIGPDAKGKYDLVFGFRRYEAAKLAGIPLWATVVENGEDRLLANFAENVARKNLRPYDIGRTCHNLLTKAGKTSKMVAARTGLSVSSVNNYNRIFQSVEANILDHWRDVGAPVTTMWLLEIAALEKPAQLEAFRALTAAPTEAGGNESEGDGTAESHKPRCRKGTEVETMLGLLRSGSFAGQGSEWVNGAIAGLEYVLKIRDGLTGETPTTQAA